MDMTKTMASIGAVLVGLYLILTGLGALFGFTFTGINPLRGVLAVAGGLLIIAAGALLFQDR